MKKFISFLLCVLLLTALVIPVSAAGEAFVVTPSTVKVKPGGTITLTVDAGNAAPECVSFAVGIKFDEDNEGVFAVTGISPADNPGGFLTGFAVEEAPMGIAALNYEKNQTEDAVAKAPTGSVGTITLKVSDNAAEGDYTIKCVAQTIPDADTSEGTAATVNSVTVTVKNAPDVVMGDVTGDGELDVFDIIAICVLIEDETLTDAQKLAADVNNDGEVDVFDIVLICQYIEES